MKKNHKKSIQACSRPVPPAPTAAHVNGAWAPHKGVPHNTSNRCAAGVKAAHGIADAVPPWSRSGLLVAAPTWSRSGLVQAALAVRCHATSPARYLVNSRANSSKNHQHATFSCALENKKNASGRASTGP